MWQPSLRLELREFARTRSSNIFPNFEFHNAICNLARIRCHRFATRMTTSRVNI